MANNPRMSFEEIRDILFNEGAPWTEPGPSGRNLISNTLLLEMLKVLVGDTERMMMNRVHDLEWPFRCMLRICQLLKSNIPRHSTNPYHIFMAQCLKDTREIYWDFDRVLSRMRTTAQFMAEVDRKLRRSVGGQVWVGGRGNGFGLPRGRGAGRGNRGARLDEQVASGSGVRGGFRGRANSRVCRGGFGGGASGGRFHGPSGSGLARGGARGRPSGRDTPSSVRFNVHGRSRSPSRTPRRRESTRSRSRSKTGSSTFSVQSCDRSRSPSPSRSRSRTGRRRSRDMYESAIDLSGEYMETEN